MLAFTVHFLLELLQLVNISNAAEGMVSLSPYADVCADSLGANFQKSGVAAQTHPGQTEHRRLWPMCRCLCQLDSGMSFTFGSQYAMEPQAQLSASESG